MGTKIKKAMVNIWFACKEEKSVESIPFNARLYEKLPVAAYEPRTFQRPKEK